MLFDKYHLIFFIIFVCTIDHESYLGMVIVLGRIIKEFLIKLSI